MQQLYFVRHCTSDTAVREDRVRPLSDAGLREAEKLTDFFRSIPVGRVVSSPYLRAVETVRGIAETHDLAVETDEDLRERAVGVWVDDFPAFARQQWADFDYSIPGGESLREVMRRCLLAVGRILDDSPDVTAVGTHGTALSVLIHAYDERFGFDGFMRIRDRMPWVVRFTSDEGRFVGWEPVEPVGGARDE